MGESITQRTTGGREHWEPPEEEWYMVNVDGAYQEGQAGDIAGYYGYYGSQARGLL